MHTVFESGSARGPTEASLSVLFAETSTGCNGVRAHAARKGFFKILTDCSATETSALSFLGGDARGEEGFAYQLNAFDPNIVESRGRDRGRTGRRRRRGRRRACARTKRQLLKSEGSELAIRRSLRAQIST
jgi:hypothetical protein